MRSFKMARQCKSPNSEQEEVLAVREQSTSDGALTSLVETFETPGSTDKPYDNTVFSTNSLDPNFTSPDLRTSWGTKSALVTIGPDQGAAFR